MSAIAGDSLAEARPPRTPKCARCRNHGILVPVRGHSGNCGWKLCNCPKCALITQRHHIMAVHKLLRQAGAEGPTPEDGRGKARTPEDGRGEARTPEDGRGEARTPEDGRGEARTPEGAGKPVPSPSPAEPTDLKRRMMSPPGISAFESVKRRATYLPTGPSMYSPGYMPTMDYFERETTRLYIGCPPMYHYPTFTPGLTPPGFRSALMSPPPTPPPTPPTSAIPYRGFSPCYSLQYGRGDFHPSYYTAISQYMPPGYPACFHYMPPTVPMNASYKAETKRSLSYQAVPDSQSIRMVPERSEMPATD